LHKIRLFGHVRAFVRETLEKRGLVV